MIDTEKQSVQNGDGRLFTPGGAGGPGRPPGTPNRLTRTIRDAIQAEFSRRLDARWLEQLDDKLFVMLLCRILPRDVKLDTADGLRDGAAEITVELIRTLRAAIERSHEIP